MSWTSRMPSLRVFAASALAVAITAAVLSTPPAPGVARADDTVTPVQIGRGALTGGASKFVAIVPTRVLDTRDDPDVARVFERSSISLDPVTDTGVAAAAGIDPAEITAVVVNTTVVKAGGRGYATMWPTGSERLTAATNNTEFAGHTIGNLVIAPLGLERKVSFHPSTDAHVTIDVLGVFVASGATDAGRFEPLGPIRHSDTRAGTPMRRDETRTFDLTTAGVPVDATGVVMNVTAFKANGPGFYRVWASGTPEPPTANVNVLSAGYAAGNQVVSGLTDGKVDIFTNVGSELTVDITGYFTAPGGDATTEGLFVPFSPGRLLDSRRSSGPTALTGGNKLASDERFALPVADRLDIPPTGATAVALNITGSKTDSRGFVKAFPNAAGEPPTSSLNFTTQNQTVPNHAITSINEATGQVDLLPSTSTHLIVDATGYFLGATGVASDTGAGGKTVEPGDVVPEALPADAPPVEPYDFLFDRNFYQFDRERPSPTINTRYDACAPLRYALNVDLANDAEIADLVASVEEIERYTGIDFQYRGVTSSGMNVADEILLPEAFSPPLPYRYLPAGVDMVIGYSNASDTPNLAGGVIGVGGGLREPADERMFRGFVVIDLPDLRNADERTATTTHELGHAMGLGHISDFVPGSDPPVPSNEFQGLDPNAGTWDSAALRNQLMYPSLNPANTSFSTGDIHGLWQLYGTQGCAGSGSFEKRSATTESAGDTDADETGEIDEIDEIDWSEVEIVAEP